jgi:hypothetical protein
VRNKDGRPPVFRVQGSGLKGYDSDVNPQPTKVRSAHLGLMKLNPGRHAVSVFSFLVLSSGFRVAGCGLRMSGFEFRISGFGFLVLGFGFRVSGSGFQVSDFGFRVSGSGFQVSDLGFRVSDFGFRAPGFGSRVREGAPAPWFRGTHTGAILRRGEKQIAVPDRGDRQIRKHLHSNFG